MIPLTTFLSFSQKMGGNSTFWSSIRHLKKPFSHDSRISHSRSVLVDASVLEHLLLRKHSELACCVFLLYPEATNCTEIVSQYAEAFVGELTRLLQGNILMSPFVTFDARQQGTRLKNARSGLRQLLPSPDVIMKSGFPSKRKQ